MSVNPYGPPSADNPVLSLQFDGVDFNWFSRRLWLESLTPYSKDGTPALTFRINGGSLGDDPAEFTGRAINLRMDTGTGPASIFRGRVMDDHGSLPGALSTSYRCLGLRSLGDRVPHTDHQTGSDSTAWNLEPTDPLYDPAKAGRTMGEILLDCLGFSVNAAGLDGYGIGGYSSYGYGAAATATLSGSTLSSVVPTNGGANYTAPPTVYLYSEDSGWAEAAVTATVSGGVVTGYSVTSGGGPWTTTPRVIVSTLPLQTVRDLAALDYQIPYQVVIQGESLLSAVQGELRSAAPFCSLHVDHETGILRFLDQRKFGSSLPGYGPTVTLYFNRGSDRIDVPGFERFRSVEHAFGRSKVRGAGYTECKMLQSQPPDGSTASDGGLVLDFGHDGLTTAQAKANWKESDYTEPFTSSGQARANATVNATSHAVTGGTVQSAGYGYSAPPPVTISGDGTGATGHATLNADGGVGSVVIDTGGSAYTYALISMPPPDGGGGDTGTCTCPDTTHVTLHSSDGSKVWAAGELDQTAGGKGAVLFLQAVDGAGVVTSTTRRIVSNPAMTPGGTCTVQVDMPLPDTSYSAYTWMSTQGGGSIVWRKLRPAQASIAEALAPSFSYGVPIVLPDGTTGGLTNYPVCLIAYSDSGSPPYRYSPLSIKLNSEGGFWLTDKPMVAVNGTPANLAIGGASTDGIPDNVIVYAAVYSGELSVTSPPDSGTPAAPQFGGTASTVYGLDETLTITVPGWRDPINASSYQGFADSVASSVQDAILEITVPVLRFDPRALVIGSALNLADDYGSTTGMEAAAVPVIDCEISFENNRGFWAKTVWKASNRKLPFSAAQFARPDRTGLAVGYPLDSQGGGQVFNPSLPPLDGEF